MEISESCTIISGLRTPHGAPMENPSVYSPSLKLVLSHPVRPGEIRYASLYTVLRNIEKNPKG